MKLITELDTAVDAFKAANRDSKVSRIAIVGCGAVTEKKYLPALSVSSRLRVTALVDVDEARARRLAAAYGVLKVDRTCGDLAGHADIAVIAAPHHLHSRLTVDAMQAGLHAFVEKPLATSMSEVRTMLDAAEKYGRQIGVGLVRRHFPFYKFVKAVLKEGLLGNIQSFDFREGGQYNWPLASDATFKKATQGGVLFDTGAHSLDLLLSWLGDFRDVSYLDDSRGGVEANCLLELTLASGIRGTVELSRTRNLRNTCIIRGERGELEVGMSHRGPVTLRLGGVELSSAPQVIGQPEAAPLDFMRTQLEEFAAALESGASPDLSAEKTLESIRLFDACKARVGRLDLPWESFEAPFDFSQLDGRTVLVLGGTGFIGGRLVEVLESRSKAKVRVLARSFTNLSAVSRYNVDVRIGDVIERASLSRALAGCDIVINCTVGKGTREASRLVNVDAVQMLVEEAARAGVKRVIHLSTVAAYGLTPDGDLREDSSHQAARSYVYGYMKDQGERVGFAAARKLGIDFRVLQPTAVYGPGSSTWTLNPIRMLRTGRVPLVNGGDGLWNNVYVDDMVLAIMCAATAAHGAGERFLISGPDTVSWREFYGAYEKMLGYPSTVSLPLSELQRLARQARKKAGNLAQIGSLFRDPVLVRRAAALPIVQKVKDASSRRFVDAAKAVVLGEKASSERVVLDKPLHLLADFDAQYQSRKTRVSIAKAVRLLGYQPGFSFDAGMRATREWARWANLLG